MIPLWKRLLRLALIAALTPVVFLLGCQSSLIYHPRPNAKSHAQRLEDVSGQRIRYQTPQGWQTAYYIPPFAGDAATAPLWLCFSGNASLALEWVDFSQQMDGRFAWLLIDYPGYGECEGQPTPKGIRESSVAALKQLALHLKTSKEALTTRSHVLGHSLGAAAALMAAADLGLKRGVLIAPFTSMTEMGRIVLGWPLCHLNLHRFDNRPPLDVISKREDARFVIFHGSTDEVIPMRMGQELALAHPEVVTFHASLGGHNDVLLHIVRQVGEEMRKLSGL